MKTTSLLVSTILLAAASLPTPAEEPYMVFDGEDTLFHRDAFPYREADPTARNGVSLRLERDGSSYGSMVLTLDDSLLRIGEAHTLWADVRSSTTGTAKLQARVKTRYSDADELVFEVRVGDTAGAWTSVELGSFALERDTILKVRAGSGNADVWLDRIYLTAAYPPGDAEARNAEHAPSRGYPARDGITVSVVHRVKAPIDGDEALALERQLLQIATSGAGLVMLAVNEEDGSTALMERALVLAEELGLRVLVRLTDYLPASIQDRYGPTVTWSEDLAQQTRDALQPIVDRIRPSRALHGYFLLDEPYPHQCDALAGVQEVLYHLDPDHPVVNSAQPPHQLTTYGSMFPAVASGCQAFGDDGTAEVAWAMRSFNEAMRPFVPGPYWTYDQGYTEGDDPRVTRTQYRFLAHRILMGRADGIVHYPFYAHRRKVVPAPNAGVESGENYGFLNAIECPYTGEFDLWAEATSLNRILAGVGPLLAGAEPEDPSLVRVECETIEIALASRPVVDHALFRLEPQVLRRLATPTLRPTAAPSLRPPLALGTVRLVYLQNLDLLAPRRARLETGQELELEPGGAGFVFLGSPYLVRWAERVVESARAGFDLTCLRAASLPARRAGMDLADLDAALEAGDVAAADVAFAALGSDPYLSAAVAALEAVAAPLSRIEAELKERILLVSNGSAKWAEKTDQELEKELTGSEADMAFDDRFEELAQQYLAAKTRFVQGEFELARLQAASLAALAEQLEAEVVP